MSLFEKGAINIKLVLISFVAFFIISGCNDKELIVIDDNTSKQNGTDILMLIVDYTTNKFEGGKEMHFDKASSSFTITHEFKSPGDFGWMKLYYSEIDELIFWGHIHWMGCGEIEFPTDILKAEEFVFVPTDDYWLPKEFEPTFPVDTIWKEYYPNSTIGQAWGSIQGLVKTREYIRSHQDVVKVYEWQPSVGCGDIADRKWIFFLKKNNVSTEK